MGGMSVSRGREVRRLAGTRVVLRCAVMRRVRGGAVRSRSFASGVRGRGGGSGSRLLRGRDSGKDGNNNCKNSDAYFGGSPRRRPGARTPCLWSHGGDLVRNFSRVSIPSTDTIGRAA